MRTAVLFTGLLALLALSGPAGAGVLELVKDDISRRHCAVEPCHRNGLAYQTRFVRDRYLRFDIKVTPARYTFRRERIMIAPPRIVTVERYRRHRHRYGRLALVSYPTGSYRVVAPARYATVTRLVLVSPARNHVVRRRPYYAYYPERIVVRRACHRSLGDRC